MSSQLATEDGLFLLQVGITDPNSHEESVELRFGEGIGSMMFDRILSRQNHERTREFQSLTVGRHLPLTHRLEESALGFGSCPFDFIC